MTKRDYIKIAAILKEHALDPEVPIASSMRLVAKFTVMLADDNERFDAKRFTDACIPSVADFTEVER